MNKLPKQKQIAELSRSVLEKCILEATEFIDDILKPVLSVKQQGKRKKISIYHSEYQIISMIATAFQVRYEKDSLSEIGGWKANRKKLKKHILMYYLYDILRETWSGSGDSRLYEYVNNTIYLTSPPTESTWSNTLENWFVDSQINLLHKGRYVQDKNSEILLLKYIYVHRFSVMQNAKTHHVEHIIPVKQLKDLKKDSEKLPINVIGNLALLEPAANTKKGDLTFLEYLKKQRNVAKLTDEEFEAEKRKFEEQLICKADILPKKLTKGSYDDFVTKRFKVLKAEFLKAWQSYIPAERQI